MKTEIEVVRLILLDFLESKICKDLFEKIDKSYEWLDGVPKFNNDQIQICFTGYFFCKN